MNPGREQLIAYLATLGALVAVYIASLGASIVEITVISKFEAFGLGTITGGLIGVLRMPQSRSVTVDNERSDPVPTKEG